MKRTLITASIMGALVACITPPPPAASDTPVERHGLITTEGNRIVDENGTPVSLAGPSFFWSTTGWGQEKYYNAEAVDNFASNWNASLVRAAIAADTREGSYLTDPEGNLQRAYTVIDAAIENGIYVIVDWHSHRAENNPEAAMEFFTDIAQRYGDTDNLIYEIYNEPLDTTDWSTTVKPYAETVIGAIREVDPDNLIIVGTQSWSQDVDKAASNPLTGFNNIAYTLHFYAASHKDELRQKARTALDAGLALFVTEWGAVSYDGDGAVDEESVRAWMDFIRANDLSHANWAVSDKDEGASLFKPGTSPTGPWSPEDLTPSGKLFREILRGWQTTQPE
ncbi:glycoside hydrolase family 5 protein [Henriciella sp.]|uniref:glycoside hydrolase family 5 protein n=1 Tax=Henriciella sp. TaxID=1968823 RepID=UPI00262BC342|nr:glycoside hydrolase family 5 protein [Henriciella sp.]